VAAKRLMSEAHRHLLLVRDIQDAPEPAARQFAGRSDHAIELASRARAVMGI
jgi:hypothetical protein